MIPYLADGEEDVMGKRNEARYQTVRIGAAVKPVSGAIIALSLSGFAH